MSEVKIPEGYKQTEVGVIPEDWDVKNFGDLFESSIPRKTIKPSNLVTFIGMQDVTENAQLAHQTIINYERVKSGFTYFEKGDVLLAKITPCFENGKGCHTKSLITKYGFGSTEFHVLRANSASDAKFIYFWTTRSRFRIDLESAMVGSAGHRRVPFSEVRSYQIPCPASKSEQTAIATALSDVDNLILSLEKLIAKKEVIKTGTMQQLLTGKTRLPEFATHDDGSPKGLKQTELGRIPEDWEVSTLGDIANFLKGSGLPKSDLVDDGQYKCIHYGQLFTLYEELISKVKSSTNIDGNIKSISNDVLMPTSDVTPNGLATASCILEKDVVLGGDILIIRANPQILNGVYFAYLINIYREQVMRLVTGSTVYHLYGNTMSKLTINLPNAKEQTAIATILSDMDKEIQALQQRLEKTKGIKQGMMQQLLTGKVRLAH